MIIFGPRMFFLGVFITFVLASSSLGQSTAPHELQLRRLADRLAHEIESRRKHEPSVKVLVLDFPNQRGMANVLGQRISESLTDLLAERLGLAYVIDQKQFRADLLSTGISPFDMQIKDVALWNAKKARANLVVLGQLQSSVTETILTVQLVRIFDRRELATASTDLTLAEETRSLVDTSPAWSFDPDVLVPCLASTPEAMGALYKTAGVSQPKCSYCPLPPYTDAARSAHYQGAIKFDAIINERGRVSSSTIIQGDDYGLATEAMSGLRSWRFKPAEKDGKPVRVCVQIESTFHLY